MSFTTPQPAPQPTDGPAMWDLVIEDIVSSEDSSLEELVADMRERDRFGLDKYGTRLQAGNGRDALADAYQEALDLSVYLRMEIDDHGNTVELVEAYHSTLETALLIRRLLGAKHPLQLWHDDTEWYWATDLDHLAELIKEHTGSTYEEMCGETVEDSFNLVELPDPFTLHVEEPLPEGAEIEEADCIITAPHAAWLAIAKPGFFATTEF